MKSKIIKKLSVNFDKEIVVSQPFIDKDVLQTHQKRLEELYKDLSVEEKNRKIDEALKDIILKDNFFNKIMEFMVAYYEFDIDENEVKTQFDILKQNLPDRPDDILKTIAEKGIQKQLVFADLQKQFNLTLTDEQLENALRASAEQVGENFDELKKDAARYEVLKNLMQEEYNISFLLNKFPLRVDLPYDWNSKQIMLFRLPKMPVKN